MPAPERSQTRSAPRASKLELQQVVAGRRHTLLLTGELDLATASALAAAVAHIPMDRTTTVVLDLHRLTFIDSTGIRAILVTRELCADCGCEFWLVPGQPPVRRVFEICGLLDHLPFRNDEDVDSLTSGATAASGVAADRLAGPKHRGRGEPLSGDDSSKQSDS
jgi:anti-sigma B factor antagonist